MYGCSDKIIYHFIYQIYIIQIIINLSLRMKKMEDIHGKAYKLFYLTDDQTNSVFEKVFICNNDVLKNIKYGIQPNIEVHGLVGSVHHISRYLVKYYCRKWKVQDRQCQLKLTEMGMDVNLEHVALHEKPSVYLIKLQPKEKQQVQTIFLALISKNQLYYQKPYDQKSLIYILIRFIGDLTNDILLLYDSKMLKQFNETDCPYASKNDRFVEMEIMQTNISTIHITDVKCQFNQVLELFEKNKINWRHSLVITENSYLQYFQAFDENEMESRDDLNKKNRKQIIWRRILEDALTHDTIRVDEKTQNIKHYKEAVKQLRSMHGRIKKQVQNLAEKCFRSSQHIMCKQRVKIEDGRLFEQIDKQIDQIYFWTVLDEQIKLQIQNNTLIIQKFEKIVQFMQKQSLKLLTLFYPDIRQQQIDGKAEEIYQQIQLLCKQESNQLCTNIFSKFLAAIEIIFSIDQSFYKKEQKIEITRFQLVKTRRNNQIAQISLKKQLKTTVFISQIKKHVPKIELKLIKDIKMFKAKFIRECKVLLISRQIEKEELYEYLLMIVQRGEAKLIAKYQQKQLIFTFDEKLRKVYLLKPNSSQKILTTFILDEFQKPKDQKQYFLTRSSSNFQIISYSISKTPKQRFYYLDSRKDTLYCYDLTDKSCKEFYTEDKVLRPAPGKFYQDVKAFNHNIYIVLGNTEVIDVYRMNINGELNTARTFKCQENSLFRGMSTYFDERNQYLTIYGENQFQIAIFENMGSDNFIRQTERKLSLGNPIIDIFYEAQDRFGLYTTYTVCKNTPNKKHLNLYHIIEPSYDKEKLMKYLKLVNIRNHNNFVLYQNEMEKVYENKFLCVCSIEFINQAQSRIPVQICSVQYGNVIPLKQGNIISNFDRQQASIQQRCQVLTFGIVQRMLRLETNKRTIVVSVMGAQSTGKSYLLNRIFGTRFTVASCRTTIGIWASLIKTQTINFLILDCEGLFGIHRHMNEQQKLIKILTSVSDFTILNLSKSMANKSHSELMANLSKSVNKAQIKSNQLYNGDLVIVIRDVAQIEQNQIIGQLQNNYHSSEGIKQFIKILFNKNTQNKTLLIYNFPPFTQTQSFAQSANKLRDIFIKKSKDRPIRNSETVLDWLKIVINQLACDDTKELPEEVMDKRMIQLIQEKAESVWKKGSEAEHFKDQIMGIQVCIQDQAIEITSSNNGLNYPPILKFLEIFNEKVLSKKSIDSVTYAAAYKELNTFISKFFDKRQAHTKKILLQYVASLPKKTEQLSKKIKQKVKTTFEKIREEKQGLRLCLSVCSFNCEQPCIKISQHSTKITAKIKSLQTQQSTKQNQLNSSKLTQQQRKYEQAGITKLKQECQQKMESIKKLQKQFLQKKRLLIEVQQQEKKKQPILTQIASITNQIKNNRKYHEELANVIRELQQIFQLYSLFLEKYAGSNNCKFANQINWIACSKQVLDNLLANLSSSENIFPVMAEVVHIRQITSELLQDKVQIQQLANSTNTEISKLTNNIIQHNTQQQQITSCILYLNNLITIANLHNAQQHLHSQLQAKNQQKSVYQLQLGNLNRIISNSIYKADNKEEYIVSSINALMKKKKQLVSVYYKQMVMTQQEVNQLYLEYGIPQGQQRLSQLGRKLKVLVDRRTNKPQIKQQLNQKLATIEYLSTCKTALLQATNKYNTYKARIMQEYNLQQNKNIYEQQINLIYYICDYNEHPDDQYKICTYIGIFGEYYNSNEILKLCWYKIMQSFEQSQRQLLSKQIAKLQEFYIQISQFDPASKRKSLQQNQQQYANIQQDLLQMSMNSSNSGEHEQNYNQLMDRKSLIQSLIHYDQVLVKCEKLCKIQSIGYFVRMVRYLGRVCEAEKEAVTLAREVVEVIKGNNPNLKINLTQHGLIKIDGEFTQSYSELDKMLKNYSFAYQKQLFAIEQIPSHSFLSKLKSKIEQIRKIFDNSAKFDLFLMYIEQVSPYFTDGEKKISYQLRVIQNWLKYAQNNQKQGLNQDNQDVFLNVLLRSCLQICGTMEKLKKNFKRYSQRKAELELKLLPMRKQYQIKQEELKSLNQLITDKQKQNQAIALPPNIMIPNNQHQKIQQIKKILNANQNSLKELQEVLMKIEKQLEELYNRKLLLDDFVIKIGKMSQVDVEELLAFFIEQANLNIELSNKIAKHKQQVEQINKIKQKISQKHNLLQAQLQKFDQQELKKSLSLEQKTKKTLISLQQKISHISQISQNLQQLQRQIEDLKKSPQIQCSCLTNHKCDKKCEAGCSEDKNCLQKAGHRGKHACNDHKCGEKCQIDIKCQIGCMKVYGHIKDEVHSCGSTHSCKQKCKYCDKTCRESQFKMHEQHNCGQSKCPEKCILCNQNCHSLAHNHNDEAEVVTIFADNKQLKKKLHLCSSSHTCQNICNYPGICSNTYQNKDGFWHKNNGVDTKYQYVQQIELKKQCTKKINAFEYKHEGECQCDVNHSCSHRCPDCKSLCYLAYGHSQSIQHQTIHRNQQLMIFAAEEQDKVIQVGNFIFEVGDIFLPCKCNQSCLRKGRGHFHLIQCPGGQLCYEKKFQYGAKHSNKVYKPHQHKKYDMLLCNKYWQVYNFKMPIDDVNLRKCNFACSIKEEHKDKNFTYCEKQAWHSMSNDRRQHSFTCNHKKLMINAIQICFLLDMSGSMYEYNKKCMETIEKIINNSTKNQLEKMTIKFSVVAYRDHRMSESPLFNKLRKLCLQKKKELLQKPLEGGLAQLMTQSTFEDVLFKLQRNYNSFKNQQNFLQKFDQSQQLILKYHYPFVLDVPSSRRFIDEKRRQRSRNDTYRILRNLQQSKSKNLKEILDGELSYFINLMEKEIKQEILNLDKHKLLQCQKFTTPEDCMKFLGKLKEGGGGDPPEAMLDGMAAASQLDWSSGDNTMRYIFHLFDAPPHGEIYDTNSEDYFPEGCPCNKKSKDIIEKIMKTKINYIFYPLTQRIKQTLQVFKRQGLKYEIKDLKNLEEFTEHASILICKQIQQTEIIVRK